MGLDMYLTRRTYIGNEFRKGKERVSLTNGDHYGIKDERISYVIETVGYWRKANAIHSWFVRNVQDGVDECQEARVSEEKLQELLDLCRSIVGDATDVSGINRELAEENVAPQDGFFFGGTEIDEHYFADLKRTISILEPIVAEDDNMPTYYYRASW